MDVKVTLRFESDCLYCFIFVLCRKKGKKGVKVDRDEVLKEAIANALLWENRLVTTESAKNEYR